MNEQHLIDNIRHHLDQGLESLPPDTCRRLRTIRQEALARPASHSLLSLLDQTRLKPALITLALVFSIGLTFFYLQGQDEVGEMAALDSALLTDDLPPEAFTDPGFRAWLEDSPEG